MIGDGVNGNISRSSVGASVAGNEVRWLEENVGFITYNAGEWGDFLKQIVQRVSDGVVEWCFVAAEAGEEMISVRVKWCLAARACGSLEVGWDDSRGKAKKRIISLISSSSIVVQLCLRDPSEREK